MQDLTVEYVSLGCYLLIVLLLGFLFSRMNNNLSDFVRSGAQGTWWIVGASMLMSGISAFTFTGNASAAFEAGPTFLIIYVANCVAFLVAYFWIGPWLRQTRAYTTADIVRERFSPSVEQFYVFGGVITQPFAASIQLLALAVFTNSAFGLHLQWTIVIVGAIVVLYSTSGGKWAVMATDFVQSLILFSVTVLVAILAIQKIGGFGEFFSYFTDPRFAEDFRLIKHPGQFEESKFSLTWIIAVFFISIQGQIGLNVAGRYLSVKDGREARWASLFALALMLFGMIIWFVPPMVARFLYESDVLSLGMENPSDGAYALIALKLLPNGMMGVMIAAMFAATMSSMDTGLNDLAGKIVRNVFPPLRRGLGKRDSSDRGDLLACKLVTLALGVIIISVSLLLSLQQEIRLFDLILVFGSIVVIPMTFPLIAGLYVKRLPPWSFYAIFGICAIPTIYSYIDGYFFNNHWNYQDRAIWASIFGAIGTVIVMPFYKNSPESFKKRTREFFQKMHTPIDYVKEVGIRSDYQQLLILGNVVMAMGLLIALILILPNKLSDRLAILSVSLSIFLTGVSLSYGARVERRKNQRQSADLTPKPDELEVR